MNREERCKVELLAPARDADIARAAIDCGADAVYMGAPAFGARQAAGNSIADIARAADYAHLYGARLYATLNTLVFEDELKRAEETAREVIAAGADALIIQDMAYMEMGLEGVEFHASTQTFNATPEKVRFLGRAGFSRVILERALSLAEIEAIHTAADVELECFVHGALCVCCSGRCYMSRTMSQRSGNRGDCMQACRLSYDLCDRYGKELVRGKHLLSLKDLNLSDRIGPMLDAGVTSFKIEGRLKGNAYVKNTVAWYRRRLDEEMAAREGFRRSSSGISSPQFDPDITRTFSRGYTHYFFDGKCPRVSTPDTPKATGKFIGRVTLSGSGWVETDGTEEIAAGDGLCFMTGEEFAGTNVNRVENGRIFFNRNITLSAGTVVYRNYDCRFEAMLERSRAKRTIRVSATVTLGKGEISALFRDEDGFEAAASCVCDNGSARDPVRMAESIRMQLSRSGDTVFEVAKVVLSQPAASTSGNDMPFVKMSQLNALRREGLEKLLHRRMERVPEINRKAPDSRALYPSGELFADDNVTNSLAERFYLRFGARPVEQSRELSASLRGVTVMKTPFCIRRENAMCPKEGKDGAASPLWIRHGRYAYRLEFDCSRCSMSVIYEG